MSISNHTDCSLVAIENLVEQYQQHFNLLDNKNITDFFTQLTTLVQENNTLILKTINDLLTYRFFVDDYQRGYKWQTIQVQELLNDIDEFSVEGNSFYCLQPIVVKYHPAKEREKACWELIDGQQRITTLYMILTYLMHKSCYHIDYKTRASSAEFLSNHLSTTSGYSSWDSFLNEKSTESFDNIDNYHFFTAYQTIEKWFSTKTEEEKAVWKEKLLKYTKVIWYVAQDNIKKVATDKSSSIDIFMRINSGKIPLTNAELIKALFLHSASASSNAELFKINQAEMAQEWDAIEHQLQDNHFWYFLNGDAAKQDIPTRIEFIFDILTNKPINSDDRFYSFRFYSEKLQQNTNKADIVRGCWQEIKNCYYRLREWYKVDDLYHLAGFLLSRKIKRVKQLWDKANDKNTTKTAFKESLKEMIAVELQKIFTDRDRLITFDKPQYGETNRQLISLLILFNIHAHQTHKTRLSFYQYGTEKWSLEHIHAQKSNISQLSEEERWKDIYADNTELLNKLKQEKIQKRDEDEIKNNQQQLEEWKSIEDKTSVKASILLKTYQENMEAMVGRLNVEQMHSLSNLALLSRNDNSALGNRIFSLKRQKIIALDKKGSFIPLATKSVFSKYYSHSVTQMHKWSKDDRKEYRKKLLECFYHYIPKEKWAEKP